jgi:hypothetical protein
LAHNKNFRQALRKARYAISATNFFLFLGFGERGKREKFFLFSIGGGGPLIHPWNGGDNHVAIYLIVRR